MSDHCVVIVIVGAVALHTAPDGDMCGATSIRWRFSVVRFFIAEGEVHCSRRPSVVRLVLVDGEVTSPDT